MPVLYDRVGVALTSVLANFATGITLLCLTFATLYSPSEGNFILSMSILYIGCPLSCISNLSTSPMLDRVAPVKMKTFVLGLNSSIYDGTQGTPRHIKISLTPTNDTTLLEMFPFSPFACSCIFFFFTHSGISNFIRFDL